MICGTPLSNAFMSCGFLARVSVRSEGLPRREASCGLAGFTPGARPTVRLSEGCVVERPGAGPPVLFGPLTCEPGVDDEPAPLGCPALCDAALEPVVPVDAAPAPLLEPAAPPELPPLDPPPLPPPPWARASPPDRARIATVAPRRFMSFSIPYGE